MEKYNGMKFSWHIIPNLVWLVQIITYWISRWTSYHDTNKICQRSELNSFTFGDCSKYVSNNFFRILLSGTIKKMSYKNKIDGLRLQGKWKISKRIDLVPIMLEKSILDTEWKTLLRVYSCFVLWCLIISHKYLTFIDMI